jgi:MFS family permease
VNALDSRREQQLVIAVAGVARFAAGVLMGTSMAVYVGRVGSEFAVGMVATAYFTGMTLAAPAWGAVADVTGRRRAVLVLTGLAATASVIPLVFVGDDAVWLPVGLRGVYALFAVGFQPVVLAVVSELGGDEGRGRSLGFFNSARGLGFAGGQVVAGVALGALLPSGVYALVGVFSLVSTVTVLAVVGGSTDEDSSVDVDRDGSDVGVGAVLGEVQRRLLPATEDREHLRKNGLRWLYVALALRNMTVLGVMGLMPLFLTRDVLGPVTVAGTTVARETMMGVLLAVNPAGQAVFMLLFGRIADGIGRKPLIVGGMAGSGLFGLVVGTATLPEALFFRVAVAAGALALIAASFSAMTTGALAFIGDVAPAARQSELMGLRSTAKGAGGLFGPPLVGAVATVTSIETAFACGATLALVAGGLVWNGLVESRPAVPTGVVPGDD